MADNTVVRSYLEHQNFEPTLAQALQEVSQGIGFIPSHELDRRTIYDADKVWRVRIAGMWEGRPAVLRLENAKLARDEEEIRAAFRAQIPEGSRVRPPRTYQSTPFIEARGYGYSLDELVEGTVLFDPAGDPIESAQAFGRFYRELRQAVQASFWVAPALTAAALTKDQMEGWLKLAQEKRPAWTARYKARLRPLLEQVVAALGERSLIFMHPHLAGTDVRVNAQGEYIVFANHMWGFRQPGYDVAFPTWGQWLARPKTERARARIARVTQAWEHEYRTSLSDLVSISDWRVMLLNRIFGAILLDVPAMIQKPGESEETIQPLVHALLEEAARLQAEIEKGV